MRGFPATSPVLLLRLFSWLVPRWRRGEWREEWTAELEALRGLREARTPGAQGAIDRWPHPLAFVLGALPHAWWTRRQEGSMSGGLQDIRYAARVLLRSPGFALVAALTLALGIGVNASMFTLVNGLLFRAPPGVREPERLVQLARSYEEEPRWDNFSYPALAEIRRATEGTVFSGVSGLSGRQLVIGRGVDAETVNGLYVTGNFFEVAGVRAALGRLLQPSDDVVPGGHPVAVLSHELWVRRFGAARDVIGRTLDVGGAPYEILGVTPREFAGLDAVAAAPQLYVPIAMIPLRRGLQILNEWGSSWIYPVARLEDGVTFDAARAAMPAVSTRLRAADARNEGIEVLLAEGVGLDPAAREQAGTLLLLLSGIAALVLLLTCANAANLFLARAAARGPEMSVRLALGASRGRVASQMLTESLLLAMAAAALAYPIVRGTAGLLPRLFGGRLAWGAAPDERVLAALLGLGLLAGLLFGALPALAAGRSRAAGALGAARATGGHTRLRDGLVVFQLAISLGLMSAAALLGRSVANAGSADPGFDPRGLTVAVVTPELTGRYQGERALVLYERLLAEVRALPGVRAATIASEAPALGGHARSTRWPAERPDEPAVQYEAEAIRVGPDFFETLGIPVLRGRTLRGWWLEPEPVAVINRAAAEFWWPGEDPLGRELDGRTRVRVVGVVGDVQGRSLRAPARPAVYVPFAGDDNVTAVVHVRSDRPLPDLARALRETVAAVDPGLPVVQVADLQAAVAASIGETRTFRWLVTAFAGLAFVLSTIGLYGLVSYAVSCRTRELGIRIALGAAPAALVRTVLRRGLALAGLGIAGGMALAWAAGTALRGLLFGVSAANPVTLAGASLLLLAVASLAAWLPARRAGRVDVVASLRE